MRGSLFIFFFSLMLSVVADALSTGQVNYKAIRPKRHEKWPNQISRSLDLPTQTQKPQAIAIVTCGRKPPHALTLLTSHMNKDIFLILHIPSLFSGLS